MERSAPKKATDTSLQDRTSQKLPADQYLVVLCNCPSESVAEELASLLLKQRLAACVTSMPVTSRYRWENELHCEREVTLVIKTTRKQYQPLETLLANAHPYEVPEIIALPISAGLPSYLQWLSDETSDL